jgi:probable rRNA maturation factor
VASRGPEPRRLLIDVVAGVSDRAAARGLAAWLTRTAPRRARGTVTVALVSDARMRRLNRAFRQVDRVTDVLSFPSFAQATEGKPSCARATEGRPGFAQAAEVTPATFARSRARQGAKARAEAPFAGTPADRGTAPALGEIAIARGVAARQARRAGHTLSAEVRVLALHGLLHLLGFDHEHDTGEMARLEERLRRGAGLPAGVIARAGGPARRERSGR